MAGTLKGSLMKKLKMKGKTKAGDMIKRMNDMKSGNFPTAGANSGVGRMEKAAMYKKMKKVAKKESKTKPQGKGIVKALGQRGTTGNFKKIEKASGKGAAIAALQNKLAARRGEKAPFGGKKGKK